MAYDASKLEEGVPIPDTDSQEGSAQGMAGPHKRHQKPQRCAPTAVGSALQLVYVEAVAVLVKRALSYILSKCACIYQM